MDLIERDVRTGFHQGIGSKFDLKTMQTYDVNLNFNRLRLINELRNDSDQIQAIQFDSIVEAATHLTSLKHDAPRQHHVITKSFTIHPHPVISNQNSEISIGLKLDESENGKNLQTNKSEVKIAPRFKILTKVNSIERSDSSISKSCGIRMGHKRANNQENLEIDKDPIYITNEAMKDIQRSLSKPRARNVPDNRKKKVFLLPYEITHKDHFPGVDMTPIRPRKNKSYFTNEKMFEAAK